MKIELIKIKFDDSVSYKYKSFKYCCDAITKNKTIELTTQSPSEDFYGICDKEFRIIPYFASWFSETVTSWEDEWENDYYYPIKFCPHCGEPIKITIVGEEDWSEEYLSLTKQRNELNEKRRKTDSKKKEAQLSDEIRELDKKIDEFYHLGEYKERI